MRRLMHHAGKDEGLYVRVKQLQVLCTVPIQTNFSARIKEKREGKSPDYGLNIAQKIMGTVSGGPGYQARESRVEGSWTRYRDCTRMQSIVAPGGSVSQ